MLLFNSLYTLNCKNEVGERRSLKTFLIPFEPQPKTYNSTMLDLAKRLPAIIYEFTIHPNGDSGFTYISESCESILGISSASILSDATLMDKLIHEDDLLSMQSSSLESQGKGIDWSWEGRMIINDRQRWMEFHSNHEQLEDGTIIRRGIIQDITKRRISARENEVRYQSLIKKLPIGILIFIDNKVVFCNDMAGSILGAMKYQELIGLEASRFVQADHHEFYLERLAQAQQGNPVPLCEQVYVRLNGSEVEVEEMAFSFLFKNQKAAQIIFRDITEKKSAEASIRKNETLFTRLFNSIPMATVMLDSGGKVVQINAGFREMFGYELDELICKNLNDHIVPEELRNEGIDLNNLIHASRVISVETIRKHKLGKIVNVILYGVPIMHDHETIGIYGVYVDITDRRKIEDELKIRNAELDNFVYKVSHDLRAPLSSILGLVNLAKVPGNTDDLMDYIDIIGNKVEHLDGFISDVLSHSKNLKMELSVNKINLQEIIESTFTDLSYLQGANDMIKHIKIEGVDFYSDPWRVSEIFRNLISNVVKYRQMDGSRTPEISIKIHVDNLRADISFADNGIGITDENLNRIFEMFFRATEQSDGSGIGLYIVKNAVDKLGGQINVSSKSGLGTRFSIILPNRISSSSISKSHPTLAEAR